MSAGNVEIAASLKSARLAMGLTQRELGQRVGMPQSHISKIEKGASDLQVSSLLELSRALGLEVKLVPRKAVTAIEGVLRSVESANGGSRAAEALAGQAKLAQRVEARFPDLKEARELHDAVLALREPYVHRGYVAEQHEAARLARYIQTRLDGGATADALKAKLKSLTSVLLRMRNDRDENALDSGSRPTPAHRLDEDDA